MAILETFPSRDNSHTILDTDGTAVAKEDNLQFIGLDVTDDSTNNKTEVKAVGLNADSLDDVCGGEISSAFIQSPFNFSYNEQIIGKNAIGDTLYQQTYDLGTIGSASIWTIGSVFKENVKYMMDSILYAEFSNGFQTAGSEVNYHNGETAIQVWKNSNDQLITYYKNTSNLTVRLYATIQYTKTTN